MARESILDKETFLSIAKASGLDIEDPHIDELYAYVQDIFSGLKAIEDPDLNDTEPIMTFIPSKE